jgi:hypothetical protein
MVRAEKFFLEEDLMRYFLKHAIATGLFPLLAVFASVPAAAETAVGSNIDSRVVLAYKVNDAAAQALLPEGWNLLTLPKGPLAGTNLLVAFIDRHLELDPEGKPVDPFASRSVAILNYGTKPDVPGVRFFVTRVYETPPVANSYGNGVAAGISRNTVSTGPAEGTRQLQEMWNVRPERGGEISLALSFQSGRATWSKSEAMPYSNVTPDFHRIYRYQQLADLAMSAPMGKALNGEISFKSSIPELSGVFDGNEALVGVLAIPVYVREVFLP